MSNILVVTGSVRPNSVNSKIVPVVENILREQGHTITTADLGVIDLPFFNEGVSPTDPSFAPTDPRVQTWTKMIADAEGVVLVTPEYNHNMSPVQLNAIDWVGKEWKDKPVVLIGYGWRTGGGQAHDAARESLVAVLGANVGETQANLFFTKDINPDGNIINETAVKAAITAATQHLLQ